MRASCGARDEKFRLTLMLRKGREIGRPPAFYECRRRRSRYGAPDSATESSAKRRCCDCPVVDGHFHERIRFGHLVTQSDFCQGV